MSSTAPARPSRRAAASRRKVVESEESEPDVEEEVVQEDESDEEFEEKPVPTPRRKTRRTTATPGPSSGAAATPKPARGRRVRSSDSPAPASASASPAPMPKPRAAPRAKRTRKSVSEAEATTPDPEAGPHTQMAPPAATPREPSEEPPPSKQPRRLSPAGTPPPATPPSARTPLKTFLTDLKSPSPRSPFAPGSPLSAAATPRPGSRDSMSQMQPPPLVVKSRVNTLLEQQQADELAGPKPRLVITHLVLVNFKSYAGRQEVGPFHAVGRTNTTQTPHKHNSLPPLSPLSPDHSLSFGSSKLLLIHLSLSL